VLQIGAKSQSVVGVTNGQSVGSVTNQSVVGVTNQPVAVGRGGWYRRAMLRSLTVVVVACCTTPVCKRSPPRSNIVIILMDTTRADRIGSYGCARPTTPHLDALAVDSERHTRAFSTSSWTLPATASLFTARFPSSHGAHFAADGALAINVAIRGKPDWNRHRVNALSAELPTFAGSLAEAGYDTGAVVAGPWLRRVFGLDSGFGSYDDDNIVTINGRPGAEVTARALSWLDGRGTKPFFLLVNYFEPHWPYQPPADSMFVMSRATPPPSSEDELLRLRYDGEVRAMDLHIGQFLDGLRERKLYDDAWIVALADHGELLGEHGEWGHGNLLTHQEIHIPLLVKRPGGSARERDRPVQIVDVAPTLLAGVGVKVPSGFQGESLGRVRHPIFAEVYPLEEEGAEGAWRALIEGDAKYGWNSLGDHHLIDLSRGPVESDNLFAAEPVRAAAMAGRLDAFVNGLPAPPPRPKAPTDEETLELLRSLHYVR